MIRVYTLRPLWEFPPYNWSAAGLMDWCRAAADTAPIVTAPVVRYGGRRSQSTRIIFSNGALDPWHGGGVLASDPSRDVTAIVIAGVGHHADFFFPTRYDTQSLIRARRQEVQIMHRWVAEWRAAHRHGQAVA